MNQYPPYSALVQCLEKCPISIFTYILLWKKNESGNVAISKYSVGSDYLTHFSKFEDDLIDLRDAGLIHFASMNDVFHVHLELEAPIKAMGYTLC